MLKKLITFLILIALVLPVGAGAATERPKTLLERCTLRHDWTDDFGSGYEKGNSISAVPPTEAERQALVWPAGTVIPWTAAQYDKTPEQATIRGGLGLLTTLPGVDATCKTAAEAMLNGDHIINEARFNVLKGCKIGLGPLATTPPGLESLLSAMLKLARVQVTIAGYAKDAAIVCMLDLLATIGDWLFVVVMIIAVIFLILAGYMFVTGAGAPDKITKARNMLIWGLVGVGVAILAKGLITLVEQLLT